MTRLKGWSAKALLWLHRRRGNSADGGVVVHQLPGERIVFHTKQLLKENSLKSGADGCFKTLLNQIHLVRKNER